MLYIYSLFIPIIILVISYFVTTPKPKKFVEYVHLAWKTLPHLFGYMFFLYYLEREQNVHTGGADLGLGIFLVPIAGVIFILRLFYWIKNNKAKNKQVL